MLPVGPCWVALGRRRRAQWLALPGKPLPPTPLLCGSRQGSEESSQTSPQAQQPLGKISARCSAFSIEPEAVVR